MHRPAGPASAPGGGPSTREESNPARRLLVSLNISRLCHCGLSTAAQERRAGHCNPLCVCVCSWGEESGQRGEAVIYRPLQGANEQEEKAAAQRPGWPLGPGSLRRVGAGS